MQQVSQPGVNFVGGQAEAQTSSALAQVLDRMSGVLYEEAGKMAVERAKVDYFNNYQISDEQIALAKNGDPTAAAALKLGGNFNVYDVAMRKLRTFDLSGRFEVQADNEFQKVLVDVTENRIDAKTAADKMSTITQGFTRALGSQDPEAAVKFQNTMGMRASVIMGKAYELAAKRQREVDTAELRLALDNDMNRLETTLEQVTYVNKNGEVRPMTDHVDATVASIYQRVTPRLGLQEAERMVTEYKAKAKQATIGVISKHVTDTAFAPDAMSAISRLDKGDAGKMSPLWNALGFEDKAKIRSNLRTVQIERQATADQADKDALKVDTQRVAELQSDFFRTGSKSALDELRAISIRNPKAISPESVFDLPKKRSEGEIANPRAEFILKTEIMDGRHPDAASIERRGRELGIGYKRLSEGMLPFLITRTNDEERDIERMFRTESKIVPGQFNISQRQNAAYAKLTTDFAREFQTQTAQAQAQGKPAPTRIQVAQQVISKRQSSEQSRAITNGLDALNKQYGREGSIRKTGIVFTEESDYADIASQADKLGLKKEDLSSIQQRLRIIKQQRDALDAQ
jgi:hypothetical protein